MNWLTGADWTSFVVRAFNCCHRLLIYGWGNLALPLAIVLEVPQIIGSWPNGSLIEYPWIFQTISNTYAQQCRKPRASSIHCFPANEPISSSRTLPHCLFESRKSEFPRMLPRRFTWTFSIAYFIRPGSYLAYISATSIQSMAHLCYLFPKVLCTFLQDTCFTINRRTTLSDFQKIGLVFCIEVSTI